MPSSAVPIARDRAASPTSVTVLDALRDPHRLAVLEATGLLDQEPGDPALDRLARIAARGLDVPVALISLVDDSCQRICAHVGVPDEQAVNPTPLSHSLCQYVVADAAPVRLPDARLDPRASANAAVSEAGVVAYLGVPLRVDGHVIGSFCAVDLEPRPWHDRDQDVLEELAEATSDILALRARTADHLVVAALERSVLRSLPDTAVLQLDQDLRVTMAEGAGFRAQGWLPEDFVGRRLVDVLPAAGYSQLAPHYLRALDGESVSFDFGHEAAGMVWWVQAAPVRDPAGAITGASVVMRDVTRARDRERALAEREEQYRLLAENSSDVISRHAPDGTYRYASPAASRVFGIAPAALVGRDPFELIHSDDRAAVAANHRRLLDRSDSATSAYRIVHADGTVRWVESTAAAIRDATGAVRELQCATRDITARRAAEDARVASQALHETLLGALEEGAVVHGSDGAILACNPSAERIFGMPERDLLGAYGPPAGWRVTDATGRDMPPEDDPVYRVLASGERQLGRILTLHRNDGKRIWIRLNAVPLRGAGGALERVLVSLSDITELREAEHRARHQADHDPLTGLPNRALLDRRLRAELDAASRTGSDLAVLFLDLDRFKVVNDSLGHSSGDELLVEVAHRLGRELRDGAATLARFGGDEFVVLAPRVTGRADVERLARRLLGVLRRPFAIGGAEYVVRASLGAVLAPRGEGEPEGLLRDADAAMFQAKADAQGGYRIFEPAIHQRAVERLSLERELRRALREGELELHYQPIRALPGLELVSAEALVRWRHPERGLIPPGDFIPVAEHCGLIGELGDWVLREACAQLRRWRRSGAPHPGRVAVNVSAAQLEDPAMAAGLAAVLAEHGLEPAALELEVTESMLMRHDGQTRTTLHQLNALGVTLALDDFGTGYSSLSQLKHLPLHAVKIDRSFVGALETRSADHAIVRAILGMARALDLRVVAEGIETEQQLSVLRQMGCDLAQGYLLGRPDVPEALA